jgi:hypothetical protein
MSEWRRKKYYSPRVLISVLGTLEPDAEPGLICLSGSQVEILRNLTHYLHYRSTWVDEYHRDYYLAPDNDQWDVLQAIVADLEDKLMNCQQYDDLLENILAAAQCACYNSRRNPGLDYDPTDDEQTNLYTIDDVVPDGDVTHVGDAACAVAQLWYQWGYEIITEKVLPASRWTWDYLLSAIAGFAGIAIGGPPVGLGLYAVAELVQECLNAFYDASETNLVNWMESHQQDIVCSLWVGILAGGDASGVWATTYTEEVSPSEEISNTDKLIINLFMGRWAGLSAQQAYANETDWATANVVPGYCSACPEEPIQGSDWWALPMSSVDYTIHFDHSDGGTYWLIDYRSFELPAGWICQGCILEIDRIASICDLKRMSPGETGCTGVGLWGNTGSPGDVRDEPGAFAVNGTGINEAECKALLAPDWVTVGPINIQTGPANLCIGFHYGRACTGVTDVWIKYLIFRGSIPE